MLRKSGTLVLVLLCLLLWSRGWADEQGEKALHITVTPGIHGVDTYGEKVKVGEYDVLNQGINHDVGFTVDGKRGGTYFSAEGTYWEHNDLNYAGELDLNRYITQEFDYFRFWHALDHDPLTNLYGVATASPALTPAPPLVTYTDLASEGGIMYSEMHSKTTMRITSKLPIELKAFFDFKREAREGKRQALTMSKCSACHVVGKNKEIDEDTVTYNPGLIAEHRNSVGRFSLSYEFRGREFKDRASAPTNYYDNAVHPGNGGSVFDDRVQYQDANLPYSERPESTKYGHVARFNSYFPSVNTGLMVSGMYSETDNEEQDIDYTFKSVFSRLSTTLIPNLSLNVRFKWIDLENDDKFVDVVEPVGSAGANAGYTWYEHSPDLTYYSCDPDFVRKSAMSREQYEVGFDATYLISRGLTFRGSYLWKQTDRDDYLVATNETETQEHKVKVGIRSRFKTPLINKRAKASITYTYRNIDDPFANLKAAFADEVCVQSGGPFGGTQYCELQQLRNVDLSNLPEEVHELRFDTTVPLLDRLSLNALYRYIDEENDSAEDWDSTTHMPSVSLWYTPIDRLSVSLSYLYMRGKTGAFLGVPVYDG
jgi:hypothetical protein